MNGNTQKKGPAIVLKVMAGDVVDIGVRSLYHDYPGIPISFQVICQLPRKCDIFGGYRMVAMEESLQATGERRSCEVARLSPV